MRWCSGPSRSRVHGTVPERCRAIAPDRITSHFMTTSASLRLSGKKRHTSEVPDTQPTYDGIIEVRHLRLLTRRSENHGQEEDRVSLSCHGNHRHESSFLGRCGEKCSGNSRQGAA